MLTRRCHPTTPQPLIHRHAQSHHPPPGTHPQTPPSTRAIRTRYGRRRARCAHYPRGLARQRHSVHCAHWPSAHPGIGARSGLCHSTPRDAAANSPPGQRARTRVPRHPERPQRRRVAVHQRTTQTQDKPQQLVATWPLDCVQSPVPAKSSARDPRREERASVRLAASGSSPARTHIVAAPPLVPPLWSPHAPACRRNTSRDSDLEAFSHYPTHGSVSPWLLSQADGPRMRTNGSSRTELDYYRGNAPSVG